jgi:hypothetical protein
MSKRCSAKNRTGKRCGAWPLTGSDLCALHSDPERAAELGSNRGRRVISQSGPELLHPAHRSLKSADDISELLEETINRVRQGLLDSRVANTIGFLAGIQLKALTEIVEPAESTRALVYSPIFDRMRADGLEPQPDRLCPASDGKVYDFYPQPTPEPETEALTALPALGEWTDEPTPSIPYKGGVIRIEVA